MPQQRTKILFHTVYHHRTGLLWVELSFLPRMPLLHPAVPPLAALDTGSSAGNLQRMWSSTLLCYSSAPLGQPLTAVRLLQIYARLLQAGFGPGYGKLWADPTSGPGELSPWQAQPCLSAPIRGILQSLFFSSPPATDWAELSPRALGSQLVPSCCQA